MWTFELGLPMNHLISIGKEELNKSTNMSVCGQALLPEGIRTQGEAVLKA